MYDGPFALTLIAAPGSARVLQEAQARVRGIARGEPQWLAEGEALDIAFLSPEPPPRLRAQAAEALAGLPVDAVIQPAANRRKRLLVADMDSTIISQECLDEIADAAGIGPQIAAITERAMRGELDFEAALKERVALLRGFRLSRLQQVMDERITLTPGARELCATMRANGARCVLVSGGFRFFTGAVAALAGFNAHYGNDFLADDEAISGVAEPILGREAKLAAMRDEAGAIGIRLDDAMAVGDGANDLAMIEAAGLGVAFRAKPLVAAQAGAQINHGDLTALLYIQGYRREEFSA